MSDPIRITPNQTKIPDLAAQTGRDTHAAGQSSFANVLSEVQENDMVFSNHAKKRIENRDIDLTENDITQLIDAVNKAESRGSQESLILIDNKAFLVNVKKKMVITALDMEKNGEGVFTQIDSVVVANINKSA